MIDPAGPARPHFRSALTRLLTTTAVNSAAKNKEVRSVASDAVRIWKRPYENSTGTHVGIHCFRHGVTSELLEAGTPIHIVSRLMRHGDSKVTLDYYAHVIGDAERVASEKFSRKIGHNLAQLESVKTKSA